MACAESVFVVAAETLGVRSEDREREGQGDAETDEMDDTETELEGETLRVFVACTVTDVVEEGVIVYPEKDTALVCEADIPAVLVPTREGAVEADTNPVVDGGLLLDCETETVLLGRGEGEEDVDGEEL